MAFIFVNVNGDGTAYVDNPNPLPNDLVTLFAYPDTGAELLDIIARDEGGHSIALSVVPEQSFQYMSAYGNITIDVYFSGSTPPAPVITAKDIAIMFKLSNNRNKGKNYRRRL